MTNSLARGTARTLGLVLFASASLGAQSTAPRAERIRVIATGDLHGSLAPYVDARGYKSGGLSGLAAVVEQARRECVAPRCISVLVDAGDIFSGTPESDLTHGREAAAAFAALRYDAVAPGNREFDWGVDTLAERVRGARLPMLAANVRRTDGAPLPWLRGDTLIRRGGLTIGIVGLASQLTSQTTNPDSVADLTFGDPATAVDERAKALRARGAQVILVVSHTGVRCEGNLYAIATGAPADRCEGEALGAIARLGAPVDLWVGGHTHQRASIRLDSTLFVSSAANGRSVTVVDLPLDASRHVVRDSALSSSRDVTEGMDAPHVARVDSLIAAASARAAKYLAQPVASFATALERSSKGQYPLGNLITDAQRAAGKADLAVTNNTGIHAAVAAGPATYGAIYDVQPFGNVLYKLTLHGDGLRAYLEQLVATDTLIRSLSGATIVYDPSRPAGSRITELQLTNGRAVVDSAEYTVVMNDYVRNMAIERTLGESIIDVTSLPTNDRDVFIAYLKTLPQPVRAPTEVRIRPVAAGATPAGR